MLFSLINVYGDLYKIKVKSPDAELKKLISSFDVVSASKENETASYLINASAGDLTLLFGYAQIDKIIDEAASYKIYSSYDEINERIDKVVENSNGYILVFDIGKSIENRPIKAVRISKAEKSEEKLPEVLFVGLHHAREWISSEVTLGILEFVAEYIDSNPFVSDILENSVLWFVPLLNPDGYLYSWEESRMWRLNRRVHPDNSVGVDLNRNYDFPWVEVDFVHGEGPFSEPETQAIKRLILNEFDEPFKEGIVSLDGLITFHSFGQIILYPPGSTEEPPEKQEYYKKLATKMADLTFSECGTIYSVMQNSELYLMAGEMTEWFMRTHGGKPSFTFELRPHMGGKYHFDLPDKQIKDSVKETIVPALYFVKHIITQEFDFSMDENDNGVKDIFENTFFDYKCDRSDLLEPDEEEKDSEEIPVLDDDSFEEDSDNEEKPDIEEDLPPKEKKGCSLLMITEF